MTAQTETRRLFGEDAEAEAYSFAEDIEDQGGTVELVDMDWTQDGRRASETYWFVDYIEAQVD